MAKYEYVTIHSEAKMSGKYSKHREVINEYIEKGYRFAGYIPTSVSANGQIMEMDLIFELKEQGDPWRDCPCKRRDFRQQRSRNQTGGGNIANTNDTLIVIPARQGRK